MKTIKTIKLERKKEYIKPGIIVKTICQDSNNFLMTSVREEIDDEEHDFHNGAKEFTFDNDFWNPNPEENDGDLNGEITSYNVLIK